MKDTPDISQTATNFRFVSFSCVKPTVKDTHLQHEMFRNGDYHQILSKNTKWKQKLLDDMF